MLQQVFPCSLWRGPQGSKYFPAVHGREWSGVDICTATSAHPHIRSTWPFLKEIRPVKSPYKQGRSERRKASERRLTPCFRGRGRVDLGVKERSWAWEQLGGCSIVLSSSCYPNLLKSAINKFSIIEIHFYCDNTCCLSWLISYFILLLPSPLTSFCLASWQGRKREAGCLVADLGQPIPILALNHSVNEHLSTDMQVPVASTCRW